jgi:hypothetical protein
MTVAAFFFGLILAIIVVHWPSLVNAQWHSVFTFDEFKELHPDKEWNLHAINLGLKSIARVRWLVHDKKVRVFSIFRLIFVIAVGILLPIVFG